MREINVSEVTKVVSQLCKDSCYYLPEELLAKLKASIDTEESPLGKEILTTIVENAELAKRKDVPICQDTGLTVVFMDIGQDVHFVGGDLYTAIHAGVADGYVNGYLRKSSVDDPLFIIIIFFRKKDILRAIGNTAPERNISRISSHNLNDTASFM